MAGSRGGRIAAHKKSASYVDETPLLSKDGATVATSVNSDEREAGVEGTDDADSAKPTASQLFKSLTVLLVAAAGAAASIASILFYPAIIVYVAGGLCLLHFPTVTYKERKLLLLPS